MATNKSMLKSELQIMLQRVEKELQEERQLLFNALTVADTELHERQIARLTNHKADIMHVIEICTLRNKF